MSNAIVQSPAIVRSELGNTKVLDLYSEIATINLSKFSRVEIKGRLVAGDGFGGVFLKNNGAAWTVDNGGTYALDSVGNKFERYTQSPVHAGIFGVVYDANTSTYTGTDNYTALQAFIDYLDDTLLEGFWGKGNFRTTQKLTISGKITLRGVTAPLNNFSSSTLVFNPSGADVIAIETLNSEIELSDFSILADNRFGGYILINATRTDIETKQDIDLICKNVGFFNYETGVKVTGRGCNLENCLWTTGRNCLVIDWPDPFIAPVGEDEKSLYQGMRGYYIRGGRVHSSNGHLIVNEGNNHLNASNLFIQGVHVDTAAGLLKGSARDFHFNAHCTLGTDVTYLSMNSDSKLENGEVTGTYMGRSVLSGSASPFNDLLSCPAGSTVIDVQFNGLTVKHQKRHMFVLQGDVDGFFVNGGTYSDIFIDNDTNSAERTFIKADAVDSLANISVKNAIIRNTVRATSNNDYLIDIAAADVLEIETAGVKYDRTVHELHLRGEEATVLYSGDNFRVWSNGVKECWGVESIAASGSITFPVTYETVGSISLTMTPSGTSGDRNIVHATPTAGGASWTMNGGSAAANWYCVGK